MIGPLLHWSKKPLGVPYTTHAGFDGSVESKPDGLWVSVGNSWRSWCESESFNLDSFKHCAEVKLKADAKVLVLKTPEELDEFTQKYGTKTFSFIDWKSVGEDYHGIIIAPYQWSRRHKLSWYYGWDCASGCIWNSVAIDTVTRREAA